jgi:hypothetical protein
VTRYSALTSLRSLADEKPATKMGQVRWAWPEIQAALAAGHTLQSIHRRLGEGGIDIDYRTLSLYIGRLERERARPGLNQTAAPPAGKTIPSDGSVRSGTVSEKSPLDPFTNARHEREKKKKGAFEFHPFSTGKNLLD